MEEEQVSPYGHLGEDAYNRLPEALKEEFRQKHAKKLVAMAAYQKRQKIRAIYCGIVGAFISYLLATLLFVPWYGWVMTGLGGAVGYFVARMNRGHLTGILMMGVASVAGSLIGYYIHAIQTRDATIAMLFTWIFWAVGGGVIGKIAESDRQKDSF
jgi:hypothetical protein